MPLSVTRYELGPIRTNCYAVRSDEGAAEAVVVDPSGDPAPLLADLRGARVAAILVTHTHWDHLLGVAELAAATGAPVYAPRAEADRLADPESAGPRRLVAAHDPPHPAGGGDALPARRTAADVGDVPGHTPGPLALYAASSLLPAGVP